MTTLRSPNQARQWRRFIAACVEALAGPPADPRFLELAAALGSPREGDGPVGGVR